MKKKKLLKKYQLGKSTSSGFGGLSQSMPKLKTWKPSYTLGATGDIKFNNLKTEPLKSNYGIDYSGVGGENKMNFSGDGGGSGAQYAIAGAMAAAQEWAKFPQQYREGQDLIEAIAKAKYKRRKFNVEQAERNVENMYNRYGYTNLYGYGYPTMKYGGSLPKYALGDTSGMYGSSMYRNTSDDYNSQLANMHRQDVEQQYTAGIFESHMDAAVSSMPGWGAIMAAAMQASDMIRGGLGEHQEKVKDSTGLMGGKDTGFQDVYYTEDPVAGSADPSGVAGAKGAIGSLVKPHHEHAAEAWGKAAAAESSSDKARYAFEGIGDMLGWTTIPRMVKSGIDSSKASKAARVAAAINNDRSMAGGTAGFGGSGTTRVRGNIVGSDKVQIKEGKMGGYLDQYRGGGLYANIHAKRARIKAGSGETMRSPGDEGAPTAANFERAAKTAKKGMGGYLESYKSGGFKAVQSKIAKEQGVSKEAAGAILAASTRGASEAAKRKNPNLRKVKGEYGGYMPSYGMGTQIGVAQEVPRDMANAEVEGGGGNKRGETIYNAMNGTMDVVKGPKHSKTKEAGVPVVLKEGTPAEGGDFVFSDYLKITDPNTGEKMSIADFSLKYKDNPRMLEYAAQEQSRMADNKNEMNIVRRAVNSINIEDAGSFQKNSIEKSTKEKLGRVGTLKKYQLGTLTEEELNPFAPPPSYMERRAAEAEVAARIAAEERQTSVQASKQAAQDAQAKAAAELAAFNARAAQIPTVSRAQAAASMQTIPTKPLSSAQTSAPAAPKTVPAAQAAASAGSSAPANFGTIGYMAGLAPKMIAYAQNQQAAGAGAASATQKSTTPTIASFYNKTNYPGKKTGWEKAMDSGAIDIGLGAASALTQGLVAGLRKNPYEDMFTPSFKPITYDKQFFERLNMKYDRDAADRAFARGQETVLASGAGPNLGANLQALENNRKSAYEKIMGREMEFNIRQDAAEKDLNARLALQTDIQNQEMQFKTESAASAAQQLSREFESERPVAIANVATGFAKDARQTLADMRYANAILGNQVDMSDNLNIARATEEIKAANPQTAGESDYAYQLRIQRMLNDAIRAASS